MNAKLLALALTLAMAGSAVAGNSLLSKDAPRALPDNGPVSVTWADPATFTELKASGNRFESAQGDWLLQLAKYMRKQADKQLTPGNKLELTIVDIQRAGRYEPWHGLDRQNIRMIREIYPPRMTVKYRETDANGAVVAEGERKLTDLAFMVNSGMINDSDPLRYEKRMIDSWLRRDFNRTAAR
jgi:hypothetical protein